METKNEKQQSPRRKKGIFVIVIVLIAAALVLGPSLLAGNRGTAGAALTEVPLLPVRAHEASLQTLHAHLDVNGDIVTTQQVEVFPDVAGRLIAVQASLGTYVRAGEIIAEIDASRPGAVFLNSPVYAPISGIVSRTPVPAGSTVSPATSITSISANGGNLEISARIPEREIAGLAPGLRAEVSLQAHPGETFNATVIRVSPIVDSVSRTKLINLRFDQIDTRITPGMFARIRINTRTYPNVLAVPAEAVISSRGVETVFVAEINEEGQAVASRREVVTGVSLQGWTEIRYGVEAGEAVITQGQQLLGGGEYLRIIGGVVQGGAR